MPARSLLCANNHKELYSPDPKVNSGCDVQHSPIMLQLSRYVAKRYNQSSVLGSYLDPLADKVLIGCVVGALGYQVPLHTSCSHHQHCSALCLQVGSKSSYSWSAASCFGSQHVQYQANTAARQLQQSQQSFLPSSGFCILFLQCTP